MSLPAFLWPTSFLMLAVTDLTTSCVSPEGTRGEIVSVKAFALAAGEQVASIGKRMDHKKAGRDMKNKKILPPVSQNLDPCIFRNE